MNKFNRIISKYLLFSFPAVIGIVIWGNLQSQAASAGFLPAVILKEILSLNIILWFIMLTYFVIALVISSELRNAFIKKVLRIKERDERESYITANAARFTFFSTLAVMICLLFFSIIDVSLTKAPEEKQIDGKKHELSLGFKCELFDKNYQPEERVVSIRAVPFSKETILIFLIIVHSVFFIFGVRRYRI